MRILRVLALLAFSAIAQSARGDSHDAGRAVVQAVISDIVAVLADRGLDRSAATTKYKVILRRHFDMPAIAAWVFGDVWHAVGPVERAEFLRLFESYAASLYRGQFAMFQSDKFRILRTEKDGMGLVVVSEIIDAEGDDTEIRWRLRLKAGRWLIRDVIVDEVSQSRIQKEDFAAAFRSLGGSVERFTGLLRRKVASLDAEEK